MQIKILRTTVCGGVRVEKGAIVEASHADANTLIRMGKADPYVAPPKKETTKIFSKG